MPTDRQGAEKQQWQAAKICSTIAQLTDLPTKRALQAAAVVVCQVHHKNTDMLGSPFLAPCLATAGG